MPTRQEAIDLILDHFDHPRNFGAMPNPDSVASGRNPVCGDVVTVCLRITGGRIETASFEGRGCTISQSAASITVEQIIGKSLADLMRMDGDSLAAEMGADVMGSRHRCATLALNALKFAATQYRNGTAIRSQADAPVMDF
ncbi:MAG: iron-sulfur cluster assembly scaffold protein [Chloroflexi bacterium]|nr:iron-sulfur cluster assembly scaffold protein [Chloroflexota bacterium]